MDLACPKCRSDNTQKLSLAVEGGTFSSKATTLGVGASGGGAGLMAASTNGSSTSQLAQKHAAPTKAPAISGGVGIVVVAWIASLFIGNWVFAVGCLLAAACAIWGWKYNFKDYPRELAEWNAKYLCMRCSDLFTPGAGPAETIAADAEIAA